jgi:NAD(P)-dependent dehydrogenase (short-subunit alcohol dehydrogenase family)
LPVRLSRMATGRINAKVAIITGGGDGIGHGIARRFAAEGAHILIAERNVERGMSVAEELQREFDADAVFQHTDVSVKAEVQAMVDVAHERWGSVDILVNNAWGGGAVGRVEHKTDELMARGLGIGLYGPLWAMQAVYPLMKVRGWGRVINMCSLNGVNAHMGTLEYNTAKEALRALSRTAAREWAASGVTVNVICPAAKSAAFRKFVVDHPEVEATADSGNPMGRLGDPEDDIAPIALFLASDDSRYLTGNTLFADGGSHINGVHWQPDLGD